MPTYTLKSNATMANAKVVFIADHSALVNLVDSAAVTANGGISTTTVAGKSVYGSAVTTNGVNLSVAGPAASTSQKFAVLLVFHDGLTLNNNNVFITGPSCEFGNATGPKLNAGYPYVGGSTSADSLVGYTFPGSNLRTWIWGKDSQSSLVNIADGVSSVSSGGAFADGISIAAGNWVFGGKAKATAPGGAGVYIFAIFVGIGPTELNTYLAGSSADAVVAALADGGASGVTGDSSITLGAITGTASGTVSTAGSVTGSSAITLGAVGSSAAGTVTAFATFTSEPLKTNNGTLQASLALDWVRLYNVTTGALVVTKTGISTNGAGVFTVTDAALTVGQTYKADWKITTTGETRMPSKAAT